jgi:hypothetical protein
MSKSKVFFLVVCITGLSLVLFCCKGQEKGREEEHVLFPKIDGEWWQVAGNPMDHKYATERQEPVDFAVWQAADGTWQIWSCMRKTTAGGEEGRTRFFYGWEGKNITESDWTPMGLAMDADPSVGETPGGLQAPHVVKVGDTYHMFYGDWVNICHATSKDGKKFTRVIQDNGKTGMFTEGPEAHTRDVMLLHYEDLWYAYYTGRTEGTGKVWVRTTPDFKNWSESTIVSYGGRMGTGRGTSECPQVVKLGTDDFYLFKTQTYGDYDRENDDIRNRGVPKTTVYHSNDPTMFGVNEDEGYFLGHIEVAAPEIVLYEGQYYIFALNTGALDGLRCAKLKWE